MNKYFEFPFESKKPIVIAGSCSAETEEQVLETAKQISAQTDISALRAGIWKPRTRPNSFEGVGVKGLTWLKAAGKEIGKPVITEVANGKHVEEALKAEIDMLWIGARTTVNPFFVQEIAEALEGINIPVFIKNPVNPDLNLWIGAIERVHDAGINNIVAIHRGFSSFDQSVYRNQPMWEIPIALKANFPQLPIICDPSHIAGSRDLIQEVCQQALNLDYDGLMVETHLDPNNAWSDKEQQLTPLALGEMLKSLKPRQTQSGDIKFQNKLEELRLKIDELDNSLLKKLADRMALVAEIGEYKKENNVAIFQLERWKEILETRSKWASILNLDIESMHKLLSEIHSYSIKVQTEIMDEKAENLS